MATRKRSPSKPPPAAKASSKPKRKPKTPPAADAGDRTGQVQVALAADAVKERADELAATVKAIDALDRKRRDHLDKWNAQLRDLRGRELQLAEEVDSGMAWVPAQTALAGVDDEPSASPDPFENYHDHAH